MIGQRHAQARHGRPDGKRHGIGRQQEYREVSARQSVMHRISPVAPAWRWPTQDALIRDLPDVQNADHGGAAEEDDEQKQCRDRVQGQVQGRSGGPIGKVEFGRRGHSTAVAAGKAALPRALRPVVAKPARPRGSQPPTAPSRRRGGVGGHEQGGSDRSPAIDYHHMSELGCVRRLASRRNGLPRRSRRPFRCEINAAAGLCRPGVEFAD